MYKCYVSHTMTITTAETETDDNPNISTAKLSVIPTTIKRIIRKAIDSTTTTIPSETETMSLLAKRNINEHYTSETELLHDAIGNENSTNENDSNEFLSISNANNLAATITSIRTNVTRVLYMYFQNVTDENGYGAATTILPVTTTPNTTTLSIADTTPATINQNGIVDLLPNVTTTAILRSHLTTVKTALIAAATTTTAATTPIDSSAASLATTATSITATPAIPTTVTSLNTSALTTAPSIIYPTYRLAIRSYENCSALFANYTQPQQGIFCNWTWDQFLCWPPTPAGVLARMHCPSGWHGIDTKKFANRKCELDGHWGGRPNETHNPIGWTDYQPCFKPEVTELMQQMKHLDPFLEIAKRTRTLEIVGLILSLLALILSLIIFCNFRSLRNNRTKIHKNLFIAMVLQVVVRLTLYLDQAFRRGNQTMVTNTSTLGIENTPYLCEASYALLEYARTAMFMWMFIEGLYLHNMVTVAVFQGRFPHTIFSLIGWGMPILMTTVWVICTAVYTDSAHDCLWNYNLTPYYWILEGPRLIVILLNFFFLLNIIRVLVVKLRQSQASDIEQTRKAVRAAVVLLPLLGITNLLHLVPTLNTPWKFALWSYGTHFLTSFQGFFIAMIYCFLNGEVRAVLLKSLAVYMSVRGHPEWVPKRASMLSGAYNTAPDTEGHPQPDGKRNNSPPNKRNNGRKASTTVLQTTPHQNLNPRTHITGRLSNSSDRRLHTNNNHSSETKSGRKNWLYTICFRGQKVLRVPPASSVPPESVVFELSEQ
ncbi:PDF receptor [Teleopsis dalmanni]|uniref:PDF receptor n=1 Tax=Teleopsis dalmanni TaxID=139649 RepID=UPI0018CF085B|nr:PDF receptor [Teleopsis dalmanni]